MSEPVSAERASSDLKIAAQILPVLGAAALGLVPFTVFSTLLVDIAGALRGQPAELGGLRGLGGISAVIVGIGYAAFAQRVRSTRAAALGLALLGVFSAVGMIAELPATVVFCFGIGAATSILNPSLQTSAASRFGSSADQGRAATMVTATTTLTAVLAAPVIGGLSLLMGWQGVLLAVAVVSVILAVGLMLTAPRDSASRAARPQMTPSAHPRGHALRTVLADRTARGLVTISCLRTAAFMGTLAVMAAVYAERHGLSGGAFTAVWTVSGVSFFLSNWWSGRFLTDAARGTRILAWGIAAALSGVVLVFVAAPFPLMLVGTALLATGHAMIAAAVTSALARMPGSVRGSALAVNGVAQSLGTFAGAALAAAGYAVAGWPGVSVALAAVTLGCAIVFALGRWGAPKLNS